jgi:hypothetical protein
MVRDNLVPAPPLPSERRLALVVATSTHEHPSYGHLAAPELDARAMTRMLGDPDICGFQVETLVDRPEAEIRRAINEIFTDRHPDDLVLVYFSGHGVRDQNGRLYFVATNTDPAALAVTAVPARFLLQLAEDSVARRQILILDCCFAGAFDVKAVAMADFATDALPGEVGAEGRCILTASRAAEYSFQDVSGSAFTMALIKGVETGEADIASNGRITVQDAYRYAWAAVKRKHRRQTPQFHLYGAEGSSILFARNPVGVRAGAGDLYELVAALKSTHPQMRLAALNTLTSMVDDDNPAKSAAARQALKTVAATPNNTLAPVAQQLLGLPPEPSAPPPPQQAEADPFPVVEFDEDEMAGLYSAEDPLGVYSPRRLILFEDEPTESVRRYLYPSDRYRGEWRRHWFDPVLAVAFSGLASGLAFRLPGLEPLRLPPQLWGVPAHSAAQWLLVAVAAVAGWRVLAWPFWRVSFTDKRLLIIRGILWRRVTSIPLDRVVNVRLSRSPLGRLLDYGTLVFDTGRWRSYRLPHLPSINDLHLRILEQRFDPDAVEARLGHEPDED